MFSRSLPAIVCCVLPVFHLMAGESPDAEAALLQLPPVGAHQLRIISPDVLELTLVTTKKPDPAPIEQWNFVGRDGRPAWPGPEDFSVFVEGGACAVKAVGFKRRVLYAPLKERDLRIGNSLYLQIESAVSNGDTVEVRPSGRPLWPDGAVFSAKAEPLRWSPAIHVNQVGYLPAHPKIAMVGYYLGSLGELSLTSESVDARAEGGRTGATALSFQLVDAGSGREVFQGRLTPRAERGFPFQSYRRVLQADFTAFQQPGEYRLVVPGLGASFQFFISEDIAGAFARTYALGLYHQRCGTDNALPFTRFVHGPCHTAPAEVPGMSARHENVNHVLAQESEGAQENPRHTAPTLSNVVASLYPFVNPGPVNVRGGHHDAGDYSKYTENSATLIHLLVFAADHFPGVNGLDNLGIPESGDGRSDILQEAKWEADYLANLQDADGGFYFLVYPRDRRYENDVTPDRGDPQVVFPKNTAVTAAATAALAQCASSPAFKEQFPEAAALYLEKARKGWQFLETAIARHGKDGAYQKITHYGHDFLHDDELAWAACEMFLATGEKKFHDQLGAWLNPANPETRKWSWWRLFEAYGHAIRSYAFAARGGRIARDQLSPVLLELCEAEVSAAGDEQLRRAQDSAYGTSFPTETKRTRTAGWYFGSDAMFDLVTALQLDYPPMNDPRPKMLDALIGNLNYEAGCNPVNVSYLTGLGWKRQREIVHQYAQNDRRVLPPSGIPIGSIQDGFGWIDAYGKELGELSFPTDDHPIAPYPFYDRWGDSFNLKTEFVVSNQARGLAAAAWLMANTSLRDQKWQSGSARITGLPAAAQRGREITAQIRSSDVDLSQARIVWEARDQEPVPGKTFAFTAAQAGPHWIEVEAQLPDGRRVFAVTNVVAR